MTACVDRGAPPGSAPSEPSRSEPASQPATRPAAPLPPADAAVPLGENRSGVTYTASIAAGCNGTAPCSCNTRELHYGRTALERIGIDTNLGSQPIPCLLADFDGNQHTDAAFLGPEDDGGRRPVVVLMFDEVGLDAAVDLPRPVENLALAGGLPTRAALKDPTLKDVVFVYDDGRFRAALKPKAQSEERH